MSNQEITKAAREVRQALTLIERALKSGEPVDSEWFIVVHGSTSILEELAVQPPPPEKIPLEMSPLDSTERNSRKASKDANDSRCRMCCNPVIASKCWFIHEDGGGDNIWRADVPEAQTADDSYGWQPVGPECARKVPAAYRARLEP